MSRRVVVLVVCLLLAGSLVVAAGVAVGHGSVSVGFTTETATIDHGDRTGLAIVVDSADDGVDTYDLSVSTDAEGIVAITNASVPNGTANVTVSQTGTRVDVSASGLAREGPSVEVLTLTLAAQSNGTATLSIDAASVLPPAGPPYLTTERDTVDVVVGADDSSGSVFTLELLVIGSAATLLVVLVAYAVFRRR